VKGGEEREGERRKEKKREEREKRRRREERGVKDAQRENTSEDKGEYV
jgi:hypothetical protein